MRGPLGFCYGKIATGSFPVLCSIPAGPTRNKALAIQIQESRAPGSIGSHMAPFPLVSSFLLALSKEQSRFACPRDKLGQ